MKASSRLSGMLILTLAIAAVCVLHVWKMPEVPAGLYQDETAIGYNAALIARTLRDEHGTLLPVFFRSFGDYKSPIYIYGVALLTKLIGPSALAIRFTSTLFFFGFLAGLLLLARRLWPRVPLLVYTAIAAGTLPWFFTISRIGFEVISQLTLTVWVLLFLHIALHAVRRKAAWWTFTGVLLGSSMYSYATARLLSVFLFLSIIPIFAAKRQRWNIAGYIVGFFATLIPYGMFALQSPEALTARFRDISFFFHNDLSFAVKITTFITNVFAHWNLEFLLVGGDGNMRHATGFGGVLFITVFVLAFFGVIDLLRRWKTIDRFLWLLLLQLVLSPVAAGMTDDGIPHALRSVLLGFYLLLFSCMGLAVVFRMRPTFGRFFLLAVMFTMLTLESALFVRHYFGPYARASAAAFDSAGVPEAINAALKEHPKRIVITDRFSYATAKFFNEAVRHPSTVQIESGPLVVAEKTCFIHNLSDTFPANVKQKSIAISGITRVRLTCFP
jgi:hypothetical protein